MAPKRKADEDLDDTTPPSQPQKKPRDFTKVHQHKCPRCNFTGLTPALVEKHDETMCDGISREKDEKGYLLCQTGCGRYFDPGKVRAHEPGCDGHCRERDKKGWFCRKGCPQQYRSLTDGRLQNHEDSCKGVLSRKKLYCSKGCGRYLWGEAVMKAHENICKGDLFLSKKDREKDEQERCNAPKVAGTGSSTAQPETTKCIARPPTPTRHMIPGRSMTHTSNSALSTA